MSDATVLVSDDEPQFAAALRRHLSAHGIEVFIDPSTDVVALAEALQPSLILLDLLQRRDGLVLLRELKDHPATRHIPVVLMSGAFPEHAVNDATCVGALQLGALAVVPKPLPDTFLDLLVQHLLPKHAADTAAQPLDFDIDAELPEVELELDFELRAA